MSNSYTLGQFTYEAESSWGEATSTFTTLGIPASAAVDVSTLTQAKLDSGRIGAYRNNVSQYVLGAMGGSVKIKIPLPGHGSSTLSATTVNALETFLAFFYGNAVASAASGTTFTGGTALVPITTASGTFTAGAGGFAGVLGDGRGNGQAFIVTSHTTTNLTVALALDASPNAADVCRSAVMLHPTENPAGTAVPSFRLRIGTANLVYDCHGCFAKGAKFTGTNWGEVPSLELEVGVSWFAEATATFPNTVSRVDNQPAVNAGGSLVVQDSGTTTRNKLNNLNFTMDITLGIEAQVGPGGFNSAQTIIGARRLPDKVKVTWDVNADAQTASPVLVGYATGTTFKQIQLTLSTTNGNSVAVYLPYVAVTERPLQIKSGNVNALRFTGMAATGPVTTSDLTLSSYRFLLG